MRIADSGSIGGLGLVSSAINSVSGYALRRRSWTSATCSELVSPKNCDPR